LRLDPAGFPFIGGALVAALIAGYFAGWRVALVFVAFAAFFAFFFRDPDRTSPAGDNQVLSPADGRVMVAGEATGRFATGGWQQITIFLSPMDVHVNRMPVSGRVTSVKYHPGKFLPAYRPDAGDLNEHTEVTLEHGGKTIIVRQIVGVLARRIVCRVRQDDVVEAGARFGVMKFGSRMDVFLPQGSAIQVKVGDRVQAGVTIIATLPPAPASSGGSRP